MTLPFIARDIENRLSWLDLVAALEAGHRLPRAEIADVFLRRGPDTILNRSAWIDGMGALVKVATVHPGNASRGRPTIHGVVTLFDNDSGAPKVQVDFHLVTKWKTAADSLLAARRLAPAKVETILLVGAGTVARTMVEAYRALWPKARFVVWARNPEAAAELGHEVATDLIRAVADADIICTATMATEPILKGEWLRPGQHLDLIGAYRADMRELDDTAMARARVFVDSRATTLHHIGELMAPIASGAIREADVIADYYDITSGRFARTSEAEITIAKNGGGAHLDLMTADYIRRVAAKG
jgi:ornithine cyclodeaminase